MTIKPFAIQGADLTLGGVNLQAGTTGVVIPGVTRATSYVPEEVNDTQDQTYSFSSTPVVIDNTYYTILDQQYTPNGSYVEAEYVVTELDGEGFIDGIDINSQGSGWNSVEANSAQNNDMWAYIGSDGNPFASFVNTDWIQIPFRVKIRAGEIETIGGGGGGTSVVFREVMFPNGAEGDTAGTIAVNNSGSVYICTADYIAVEPQTFDSETVEDFLSSQTAHQTLSVEVVQTEYPDITAILNANIDPYQWTLAIDIESPFNTPQQVVNIISGVAASGDFVGQNIWLFYITDTGNVHTGYNVGTAFTLVYTPAGQPAIWEQLSTGSGSGVDGLTGDTSYTPEAEGDTRYSLNINDDINLNLYQSGSSPNNFGPGISLGADNNSNHNSGVVAIGNDSVGYNSKHGGVYIGYAAGWNSSGGGDGLVPQGEYAVAIGAKAAYDFAQDNSITLNASGAKLNPTGAGLFVKPIQQDLENVSKALYYNVTTGEVTYASPTTSGDNQVWVETFVTVDGAQDIPYQCVSVEYDADGSVIALFMHSQNNAPNYFSAAKFDASGTVVWELRVADGSSDTDGWGLAVDSNNGAVYIAGQYNGGPYNFGTLTKLDSSSGNVIWHKSYDTGSNYFSPVVDVDSNGDVIMAGVTTIANEDAIITTKVGGNDGVVIWSQQLRGQNGQEAWGMGVGPSNEVVAVGYGYNTTTYDAMATVYSDPPSNPNWTNNSSIVYGQDYQINYTFTDGVPTFTVVVDRVGNRIVDEGIYTVDGAALGGVTGVDDMTIKVGTLATNNTADVMLVAKYDTDGVLDWQKTVQFDPQYDCDGADADIDSDGNIYVCGNYSYDNGTGGTNSAMLLFKFDSNGVKQWSRTVVGDCWDYFTSVVVGPDDYLYLSGQTARAQNSDFVNVVAKYDKDGTVIWQRLIDYTAGWNGGQSGSNIAVRNGYLAYGAGYSAGPSQQYAYIAQLPTDGTTFTVGDWAFSQAAFSGLLDSSASNITVTDSDKINDAYTGITDDNPIHSTDNGAFLVITKLEPFPPTSAGSIIEYRDDVNFPTGEVGDTAGTIVVTKGGATFLCIADYVDTPAQEFTVVSSEEFSAGQTSYQRGILTIQTGDFSDVDALWNNRESAIPSGWTIASTVLATSHDAYDFGNWSAITNGANTNSYITWKWDSQDNSHIASGTEFTLTYTPTNRKIWVRLDNGRFVFDANTITVDGVNNNDLTITTPIDSAVAVAQINLVEDDSVTINMGFDESTVAWQFKKDGRVTFPDGTKQETAYVVRNINFDGGGAAVHYEQEIGFVDGGFSATRHGVADPVFNGGDRLTEDNQYNLNGGGA